MSCNCLKPGRGVKDFVSLNYFVMHFFISTHLQVNPSILNVLLIMIKSQSMTVINAIIFFYRLTALIYIYIHSGYGKYSDPLKFFTLCYIAAIC